MNQNEFMRLAIAKAQEGVLKGQTPFGACIVRNGEVISCAHNMVWDSVDITAHAEINALRQASRKMDVVDLTDCTLYSTCEPCPMCFSACHWARINTIVYGVRIKDAQRLGFHELMISNKIMRRLGKSSITITGGVLREENLQLFSLWAAREDRKIY